jgi:hypothetical protein
VLGRGVVNAWVAEAAAHDGEHISRLPTLGGGPLSFPSHILASTFSCYLIDRDSPAASTLQFGEGGPHSDAVSAPLLRSPRTNTFYYVGLAGISVGGQQLSIPDFGVHDGRSGDRRHRRGLRHRRHVVVVGGLRGPPRCLRAGHAVADEDLEGVAL